MRKSTPGEQGIALVIVMTAVAILSVFLADLYEETGTAYATAAGQRDSIQAEYMAKSATNLTRLMVSKEPAIRTLIAPMYQALLGRRPPQLPVWKFANVVLGPFCNPDMMDSGFGGFSFDSAEGFDNLPGSCEVVAAAESSKINVNIPLRLGVDEARKAISSQLFGLMDGYRTPSPYDEIFGKPGRGEIRSTRLDVISSLIDWWDDDTSRSMFDPGSGEVSSSAGEDAVYQSLEEPYQIKNAPYDSIEELRLIRGLDDTFWATFVEPQPDDPESRQLTIYGSGQLNPNEASPQVLIGSVCAVVPDVTLCKDNAESAKFIQLLLTARSIAPVPFFPGPSQFINFLEGKGGERALYPMLQSFLGEESALLFRPIVIEDAEVRRKLTRIFGTTANIISVHATGYVGRSRVKVKTVLNFDRNWTPPPPNAGVNTGLGIIQYYRTQ